MLYLGDTNLPAIFQPTELFQLLDFFELTLGKSRVFEQGIALEDVKAKVLPVLHMDFLLGVAHPGDRRAGKIKSIGIEIKHGLDDIGIHDVGDVTNWRGDGSDLCRGILEKRCDRGVNGDGIDEGLVALNVDEDIAGFMCRHFGDALGAGAVVGASHSGFAPKGQYGVNNALIVGGDKNPVDRLRELGLFVNALHHGLAGQVYQRFAWQTGGSVARRNHDNNLWIAHDQNLVPAVLRRC